MYVATATDTKANNVAPESSKLCTQILQILTNTSKQLSSVQSVKAAVESALHSSSNRSNSNTPLSSIASISCCSSGGDVAEVCLETDSGKSSCGPLLLDESVDSGIMVEFKDLELQKRIQQCQRILKTLERNQENYQRLRDRLSKISDRKNRKILTVKQQQEPFCNVCCSELNLNDPKCFVTCCSCNKAVCRNIKCADWMPTSAQWECQLCYTTKESFSQTSTWVAEQMSFNHQKMVCPMRARSEIYIPINDFHDSNMQFESVSQMDLSGPAITIEQKVKIREYVEDLVANILGGSLDKIAVGQLSKSENYLPGIINGARHPVQSNHNDFSDISETRLRQLITTIIAETLRLPILTSAVSELNLNQRNILPLTNGNIGRHHEQQYFEPDTYHGLLATAVLNRLIGKEGNLISPEGAVDNTSQRLDTNYNVENRIALSCSSVEPRSDFSYSDDDQNNVNENTKSNYVIGRESALSDYIASHTVPLPDLSTPNTDDEEGASVGSSLGVEGTWEDNWLFKKRHSSLETGTISSANRMLIPAPKEDIRAQIGDKVADEVSDLSEMGSDTDESSQDILEKNRNPVNDRLLNKHLIGGENTKAVLDELMDAGKIANNPQSEQTDKHANKETIDGPSIEKYTIQLENPSQLESKDPVEAVGYPLSAISLIDSSQESEDCIGFSSVEYIANSLNMSQDEIFHDCSPTQTPSVIEILAAMALGPMLAVPASDQQTMLTPSEVTSLKELSDLALAEIQARSSELTHQSLTIIQEEISEEDLGIIKTYNSEDEKAAENTSTSEKFVDTPVPYPTNTDQVDLPPTSVTVQIKTDKVAETATENKAVHSTNNDQIIDNELQQPTDGTPISKQISQKLSGETPSSSATSINPATKKQIKSGDVTAPKMISQPKTVTFKLNDKESTKYLNPQKMSTAESTTTVSEPVTEMVRMEIIHPAAAITLPKEAGPVSDLMEDIKNEPLISTTNMETPPVSREISENEADSTTIATVVENITKIKEGTTSHELVTTQETALIQITEAVSISDLTAVIPNEPSIRASDVEVPPILEKVFENRSAGTPPATIVECVVKKTEDITDSKVGICEEPHAVQTIEVSVTADSIPKIENYNSIYPIEVEVPTIAQETSENTSVEVVPATIVENDVETMEDISTAKVITAQEPETIETTEVSATSDCIPEIQNEQSIAPIELELPPISEEISVKISIETTPATVVENVVETTEDSTTAEVIATQEPETIETTKVSGTLDCTPEIPNEPTIAPIEEEVPPISEETPEKISVETTPATVVENVVETTEDSTTAKVITPQEPETIETTEVSATSDCTPEIQNEQSIAPIEVEVPLISEETSENTSVETAPATIVENVVETTEETTENTSVETAPATVVENAVEDSTKAKVITPQELETIETTVISATSDCTPETQNDQSIAPIEVEVPLISEETSEKMSVETAPATIVENVVETTEDMTTAKVITPQEPETIETTEVSATSDCTPEIQNEQSIAPIEVEVPLISEETSENTSFETAPATIVENVVETKEDSTTAEVITPQEPETIETTEVSPTSDCTPEIQNEQSIAPIEVEVPPISGETFEKISVDRAPAAVVENVETTEDSTKAEVITPQEPETIETTVVSATSDLSPEIQNEPSIEVEVPPISEETSKNTSVETAPATVVENVVETSEDSKTAKVTTPQEPETIETSATSECTPEIQNEPTIAPIEVEVPLISEETSEKTSVETAPATIVENVVETTEDMTTAEVITPQEPETIETTEVSATSDCTPEIQNEQSIAPIEVEVPLISEETSENTSVETAPATIVENVVETKEDSTTAEVISSQEPETIETTEISATSDCTPEIQNEQSIAPIEVEVPPISGETFEKISVDRAPAAVVENVETTEDSTKAEVITPQEPEIIETTVVSATSDLSPEIQNEPSIEVEVPPISEETSKNTSVETAPATVVENVVETSEDSKTAKVTTPQEPETIETSATSECTPEIQNEPTIAPIEVEVPLISEETSEKTSVETAPATIVENVVETTEDMTTAEVITPQEPETIETTEVSATSDCTPEIQNEPTIAPIEVEVPLISEETSEKTSVETAPATVVENVVETTEDMTTAEVITPQEPETIEIAEVSATSDCIPEIQNEQSIAPIEVEVSPISEEISVNISVETTPATVVENFVETTEDSTPTKVITPQEPETIEVSATSDCTPEILNEKSITPIVVEVPPISEETSEKISVETTPATVVENVVETTEDSTTAKVITPQEPETIEVSLTSDCTPEIQNEPTIAPIEVEVPSFSEETSEKTSVEAAPATIVENVVETTEDMTTAEVITPQEPETIEIAEVSATSDCTPEIQNEQSIAPIEVEVPPISEETSEKISVETAPATVVENVVETTEDMTTAEVITPQEPETIEIAEVSATSDCTPEIQNEQSIAPIEEEVSPISEEISVKISVETTPATVVENVVETTEDMTTAEVITPQELETIETTEVSPTSDCTPEIQNEPTMAPIEEEVPPISEETSEKISVETAPATVVENVVETTEDSTTAKVITPQEPETIETTEVSATSDCTPEIQNEQSIAPIEEEVTPISEETPEKISVETAPATVVENVVETTEDSTTAKVITPQEPETIETTVVSATSDLTPEFQNEQSIAAIEEELPPISEETSEKISVETAPATVVENVVETTEDMTTAEVITPQEPETIEIAEVSATSDCTPEIQNEQSIAPIEEEVSPISEGISVKISVETTPATVVENVVETTEDMTTAEVITPQEPETIETTEVSPTSDCTPEIQNEPTMAPIEEEVPPISEETSEKISVETAPATVVENVVETTEDMTTAEVITPQEPETIETTEVSPTSDCTPEIQNEPTMAPIEEEVPPISEETSEKISVETAPATVVENVVETTEDSTTAKVITPQEPETIETTEVSATSDCTPEIQNEQSIAPIELEVPLISKETSENTSVETAPATIVENVVETTEDSTTAEVITPQEPETIETTEVSATSDCTPDIQNKQSIAPIEVELPPISEETSEKISVETAPATVVENVVETTEDITTAEVITPQEPETIEIAEVSATSDCTPEIQNEQSIAPIEEEVSPISEEISVKISVETTPATVVENVVETTEDMTTAEVITPQEPETIETTEVSPTSDCTPEIQNEPTIAPIEEEVPPISEETSEKTSVETAPATVVENVVETTEDSTTAEVITPQEPETIETTEISATSDCTPEIQNEPTIAPIEEEVPPISEETSENTSVETAPATIVENVVETTEDSTTAEVITPQEPETIETIAVSATSDCTPEIQNEQSITLIVVEVPPISKEISVKISVETTPATVVENVVATTEDITTAKVITPQEPETTEVSATSDCTPEIQNEQSIAPIEVEVPLISEETSEKMSVETAPATVVENVVETTEDMTTAEIITPQKPETIEIAEVSATSDCTTEIQNEQSIAPIEEEVSPISEEISVKIAVETTPATVVENVETTEDITTAKVITPQEPETTEVSATSDCTPEIQNEQSISPIEVEVPLISEETSENTSFETAPATIVENVVETTEDSTTAEVLSSQEPETIETTEISATSDLIPEIQNEPSIAPIEVEVPPISEETSENTSVEAAPATIVENVIATTEYSTTAKVITPQEPETFETTEVSATSDCTPEIQNEPTIAPIEVEVPLISEETSEKTSVETAPATIVENVVETTEDMTTAEVITLQEPETIETIETTEVSSSTDCTPEIQNEQSIAPIEVPPISEEISEKISVETAPATVVENVVDTIGDITIGVVITSQETSVTVTTEEITSAEQETVNKAQPTEKICKDTVVETGSQRVIEKDNETTETITLAPTPLQITEIIEVIENKLTSDPESKPSAATISLELPFEIGTLTLTSHDDEPTNEKIAQTQEGIEGPTSRSEIDDDAILKNAETLLENTTSQINKTISMQDTSAASLGNQSQRRLRRQRHVDDTTPSCQSKQSVHKIDFLATISKMYIRDKRLLATIQNRRRTSALMHKFLNCLDSEQADPTSSSSINSSELLTEKTLIITSSANQTSSTSADATFHFNPFLNDSSILGDIRENSLDFINEILFSDQLSADSNYTDDSISTNIEQYINSDDPIIASTELNTYTTNHIKANNNDSELINGANKNACAATAATCMTSKGNLVLSEIIDDEDGDKVDLFRRFVPGSIAEREYKKWNNAVEMPNNPYAPEALKRRISGSSAEPYIDLPMISPSNEQNPLAFLKDSKSDEDDEKIKMLREQEKLRYSRDYYINAEEGVQILQAANNTTNQRSQPTKNNDEPCVDNVVINEHTEQTVHSSSYSPPTEPSVSALYCTQKVLVLEDAISYTDTLSSAPSLQSYLTTSSDDSNTVYIYDFHKQETRAITRTDLTKLDENVDVLQRSTTQCSSLESAAEIMSREEESNTARTAGGITPIRGSTPMAFKFLQPKRRLIDPSQVRGLSVEDEAPFESATSSSDKSVIEEDVAQALPSVKALAQAFLLSTNTMPQVQRRWTSKLKTTTAIASQATSPKVPKWQLEPKPSVAEIADEYAGATGTSIEIPLDLNVPEVEAQNSGSDQTSPTPSRTGFLKSNIAFFENLKFK